MTRLWPRLPAPVARSLFVEYRDLSLPELSRRAACEHPAQTFAATGGSRADIAACTQLRDVIVQTATLAGFPSSIPNLIPFDRALATLLTDAMPMAIAEASNRHVWNFTTLVLAPDVTAWRFGFGNIERWLCSDMTRHMHARLWWQSTLLIERSEAGADFTVLGRLTESDLNQLLERSTLGGCRPLVRSLARAVIAAPSHVQRRSLIRDSSARLLREMSLVDHLSLTSSEVDAVVKEVIGASIAALTDGSRAPDDLAADAG